MLECVASLTALCTAPCHMVVATWCLRGSEDRLPCAGPSSQRRFAASRAHGLVGSPDTGHHASTGIRQTCKHCGGEVLQCLEHQVKSACMHSCLLLAPRRQAELGNCPFHCSGGTCNHAMRYMRPAGVLQGGCLRSVASQSHENGPVQLHAAMRASLAGRAACEAPKVGLARRHIKRFGDSILKMPHQVLYRRRPVTEVWASIACCRTAVQSWWYKIFASTCHMCVAHKLACGMTKQVRAVGR